MNVLYVIIGGLVGLALGSAGRAAALGLAVGLALGLLYARTERLRQRLDELTRRSGHPNTEVREELVSGNVRDTAAPRPHEGPIPRSPETIKQPARASAALARSTEPEPAPWQRLPGIAKNWITTGNVPAKVGILVSFVGVSFLLKYAIDRNLFNMPIELRLLAVALAGLAMLAVGWRLRERRRGYALSLQGGGAGILFLTIYAAMRVWQLLPETWAFLLLFAVAFSVGALAVLQNARSLALFGVVGGFLAPVLASTGQGSHVVLFSYYLVINLAILGIAWFRAWRELNLVGFLFTFFISCYWGYRYFTPALFSSTEPFLVLYFLFYQGIAILYALRRPVDRPDAVDGTLVFGTPVIAFGLQSALLYGSEYGLAISAAALALFYGACTLALRHRPGRTAGRHLELLTESYLALAVTFATLAIPLAFDARWTSAAWALEGAALVWVGTRQNRHLANLAGTALVLLSGIAFSIYDWSAPGRFAVLNGNVLGCLMVSLGALFSAARLDRFQRSEALELPYRFAAGTVFAWGVIWWLAMGWMEILLRAPPDGFLPGILLFTAASATAAAGIGRWRDWNRMRAAPIVLLPILFLLAVWGLFANHHYLLAWGWFAWPAALATQWFVVREMDARASPLALPWHLASLYGTTTFFALEAAWRVHQFASANWAFTAGLAMTGLAALLVWSARQRPGWPVATHWPAYRAASLLLVTLQVVLMALLSLDSPGNPAPLPYLPLLNPYGAGMLFAAVTALLALRVLKSAPDVPATWQRLPAFVFAPAFFVMTTAVPVRAVHYFAGVPWDLDALYHSVQVQTSLSVYWGLLGFAGMIAGARRAQRLVWIAGAACMALVVIKLFLVDLGNSGTVERIVSFIATGVLLLVVGYFAPAPPKPQSGGHHE